MLRSPYIVVLHTAACLMLASDGQTLSPVELNEIRARWQTKFDDFFQHVDNGGLIQFGLTKHCQADMKTFFRAMANFNEWAWMMVDSWGLPEPGLSNEIWEGRVTQCRRVHSGIKGSDGTEINGKYCILEWPMLLKLPFVAGVGTCMPSSCREDDVYDIIRTYVDFGLIEVPLSFNFYNKTNTWSHCAEIPDFTEDNGAIAAVAILSFFAFLGVFASIYDVITEHLRARRISTNNLSNNRVSSDVNKSVFKNKAFLPGDFESDSNIRSLGITYKSEDGDIVESSGRNMADSGSVVHMTTDTIQTAPQITAATENKQPNVLVRLLLCFSVYRHLQKLATFKHPPKSFRCLNAIRFLAFSWIVLGHSWRLGLTLTERPVLENFHDMYNIYMSRVTHEAINNMNLSVETFFVLSAMLTTVSFLKQVKRHNGKPPCSMFGLYYFHRYWRLTPVYMLVLMFYATLFRYLGTGPFYPVPSADADGCRSNWWKHVIYLNNLIKLEDTCMAWSWYLACDFQFYVIAPIFLSLLYWVPVAGIVLTTLAICGNLIAVIYINHGIHIRKDSSFWEDFYVDPWTRCGPYFVGMFVGYFLVKYKSKPKMNKVGVGLGWLISLAAISTSVFLGHSYANDSNGWPVEAEVTFLSVQRLAFATGVGWIAFACCTGYGGFINSILSWVGWVPLAKLCYTGYLVHPIIVYYTYYTSPVQVFATDWIVINYFLSNVLLTLGASFLVSGFLEIPFVEMEKVMFSKVKK